MSTQPDPKHVEFALDKYGVIHPELSEIEYYVNNTADALNKERDIINIPIDLDFCNSLPIDSNEQYIEHLLDVLFARHGSEIYEKYSGAMLMHKATIAQRLQAYYESHNDLQKAGSDGLDS